MRTYGRIAHICATALAVCVPVLPAVAACEGPEDILTPPKGLLSIYTIREAGLLRAIRKCAAPVAATPFTHVQVLVQPSFEPPWVLNVYHGRPTEDRWVELVTVYGLDIEEPNAQAIACGRAVAPISKELAEELERVWTRFVVATRYEKDEPTIISDGIEYQFVDRLERAGLAHSPRAGTCLADLVHVTEVLREYAAGDAESREVSLGILIAALRALEARQALPSAATQSNSAQQPTGAPDSE